MKKNTVILFVLLIFQVTSSVAGNHGGKGHFMKHMVHANPVPNYVSVIKKNSDTLGLSKEQISQVMAWNKANSKQMHDMVMSVIDGEMKMKQASLANANAQEILKIAKEVHETRMNIIEGKTRCRDHIKAILNDDQWEKLTLMIINK
jgi:hypothetical protein